MKVIMKVVKMKKSHILYDLKTNQDNLEQAYIALWKDKMVKFRIGYYIQLDKKTIVIVI